MRLVFALAVFLGLAATGLSQTFQAQLSGAIRAPTGAPTPNPRVTATNVATNVATSTQSNELGLYRFPALPPAQYRVSVSMTGFKTQEQGPITLAVNQALELN